MIFIFWLNGIQIFTIPVWAPEISANSSLLLCSASGELTVYACLVIVHPETQGILIQTSGVLYIAPFSFPQILAASASPNSHFYSEIQQDHFVILGFPLFFFAPWFENSSRQNTWDPRGAHLICFPSFGLPLLLSQWLRASFHIFSSMFKFAYNGMANSTWAEI